jgi:hypothetical protein
MDKILIMNKLIDIVKTVELPDEIEFLHLNLIASTSRLYFLLWGPTGPFEDGYQIEDWVNVSLLLASWIVEVFNNVNKNMKNYELIKEHINNNDTFIQELISSIAISILDHDLIKIDEKSKLVAKSVLKSKTILPTINKYTNKLLLLLEGSCCFVKKSNKSIEKKLQKRTLKQSIKTKINSVQL